jgi:hypothetical protein
LTEALGGEILATILWFVLGDIAVFGVAMLVFGLFVLIASATDAEWVAGLGVLFAWIAAIATVVIVWWNIITHALAAGSLIWGW